jgi:hypothetical protein
MEQCCRPLAVEIIPGNHCYFSTLLPRERKLSLAYTQRCIFLNMEQCCALEVEIVPGKHCDFSTYHAKRARAQSGACAEVKIPVYGTALWSPGIRIFSRKPLRFQHLSYQESESSVLRMCRDAFSGIWNSAVVPWK